eukprot:TRINITY_DN7917_c0_g1_i10.p1 TRINITY_DN7917_c0_g1~~TRINITY_DN7917_c0_g1_i10.p1  ORF type:complete len:521 (+),score=145.67 TRINITY_DN7917_c0_g1_i10:102-1565(+)
MELTTCPTSVEARRFLSFCEWNLPTAINSYLEMNENKGQDNQTKVTVSGTSKKSYNSHQDLPPLESMPRPKTMRLTEDDEIHPVVTQPPRRGLSVFEPFLEIVPEYMSGTSDKRSKLAQLFASPKDIIESSYEEALERGEKEGKYVIVTIHDPANFQCQLLNRDTWSDSKLKEFIRCYFFFWQGTLNQAVKYSQYYSVPKFPHIAILDPITGERVKVWEQALGCDELLKELSNLLKENPLHPGSGSPPPPPPLPPRQVATAHKNQSLLEPVHLTRSSEESGSGDESDDGAGYVFSSCDDTDSNRETEEKYQGSNEEHVSLETSEVGYDNDEDVFIIQPPSNKRKRDEPVNFRDTMMTSTTTVATTKNLDTATTVASTTIIPATLRIASSTVTGDNLGRAPKRARLDPLVEEKMFTTRDNSNCYNPLKDHVTSATTTTTTTASTTTTATATTTSATAAVTTTSVNTTTNTTATNDNCITRDAICNLRV